ncbi:MAG: hypothetical protein HY244_09730 [Rhizobiales bacterium]|nr:hypothetical protein [Hyphomicrobiales bacterium]
MGRFLLALPLYLAMLLTAAAGPSMSSAWLKITVEQDECIKHGKEAVQENSFNTRFEVLGNSSIYGERGDYTALVRCAAEMNMAYFVIAGPKGDAASRYMNAIRDRVTAALSGSAPAAPSASEKSGSSSAAINPSQSSGLDDLPGQYSVAGVNPNGSTYRGEVTISEDGGVYNFRWRISNGDTFRGKGRLRGRILSVDWGQKYPVIYHVDEDGTLRGKWANGRASEDLTPNR